MDIRLNKCQIEFEVNELTRNHKAIEGRDGRRRNCRRIYDSSNVKRQEVNSLLLLLLLCLLSQAFSSWHFT